MCFSQSLGSQDLASPGISFGGLRPSLPTSAKSVCGAATGPEASASVRRSNSVKIEQGNGKDHLTEVSLRGVQIPRKRSSRLTLLKGRRVGGADDLSILPHHPPPVLVVLHDSDSAHLDAGPGTRFRNK
jgi:hypothetical protein